MSACYVGGDIHHSEYSFRPTTCSVEIYTQDEARASNFDLMEHIYAGCRIRPSANSPSTHSGE